MTYKNKSKQPQYPDLLNTDALGDIEARVGRLSEPYATGKVGREAEDEIFLEDVKLMYATYIASFVRRVESGDEIDRGTLRYFATQFKRVLAGEHWDRVLKLPGREVPDNWHDYSRTDRDAQDIHDHVQNLVVAEGLTVTKSMTAVSELRHISFEKVRAAYYKWKPFFDEVDDLYAEDSKNRDRNLE